MASVVRYPYASLPHTHTITHAAALPLARATFSSALMQQPHVAITTPVPTSQPQPQPHVQPQAQAQPQPQAKPVVVQQTQPSSSSSSSTSSGPQLTILRQHSSNEEKVTNHIGVSKTVHVVVKNAPFVMQVGVSPNVVYNRVINFNHLTFDAVLLYDTEPLSEKTVDYVKVRPLEHKVKVHDHGDQATIEVRIKVLTSQHENSFFRVKVAVLNPATNELYHPSLVAYSDPIKVISKPEQIKKKLPSKKRSLNDTVAETISRIEEQQVEQQLLIEKLLEQQKKNQQNMDTCFSLDALAGPNFSTPGRKEEKKESFEAAFSAFLSVYTSLKAEERPSKIRKLVRNSTTQETETISHLLEGLSSHGACRFSCAGGAKQSPRSTSSCACKVCPYQKELERIDEFYKDFLSAPLCSAPMNDLLELKL